MKAGVMRNDLPQPKQFVETAAFKWFTGMYRKVFLRKLWILSGRGRRMRHILTYEADCFKMEASVMDVVITTTKHNVWKPQQNRTAVQFLRLNETTAKDFTKGEEKKNAFSLALYNQQEHQAG